MSAINLSFLPLISLLCWVAMFALKRYNLFVGDCMGLVYHLALIPVVQHLPGGIEVQMAGYIWLYLDALIDIISINKMGSDIVWSLRMGVHLFACIWITGASMGMPGAAHYIGIVLGVGLGLHAVFGIYLPKSELVLGIFVAPMMIAWLINVEAYLGLHVA